jgi:hypothetical protein
VKELRNGLQIIKLENMKTIILFVMFMITTYCKAQINIESLKGWSGEIPANTYLKDMDDDFLSFVGEYEYSNNGTTFKIKLIKRTEVPMNGHYQDMIVGEIEYTVQNVNTLVNTMGNINVAFSDPYNHAINSSMIIDNNDFGNCTDCAPNEIRISASMFDTKRGSEFIFRKITVGGVPALKIFKRSIAGFVRKNAVVSPPIIPDGEYVFIKIN